jgi:hypothetical protein
MFTSLAVGVSVEADLMPVLKNMIVPCMMTGFSWMLGMMSVSLFMFHTDFIEIEDWGTVC